LIKFLNIIKIAFFNLYKNEILSDMLIMDRDLNNLQVLELNYLKNKNEENKKLIEDKFNKKKRLLTLFLLKIFYYKYFDNITSTLVEKS